MVPHKHAVISSYFLTLKARVNWKFAADVRLMRVFTVDNNVERVVVDFGTIIIHIMSVDQTFDVLWPKIDPAKRFSCYMGVYVSPPIKERKQAHSTVNLLPAVDDKKALCM